MSCNKCGDTVSINPHGVWDAQFEVCTECGEEHYICVVTGNVLKQLEA